MPSTTTEIRTVALHSPLHTYVPIYVNCGSAKFVNKNCFYVRMSSDVTQFFIAVAIFLGVLEKAFFVAEYAVVNTEGVPCEWQGEGGCGGRGGASEGVVGGEVLVRVWWEGRCS